MTLHLADKDTACLFGSVEIPIVGGRHHGRCVLAHRHGVGMQQENSIGGEYYSPHWQGDRCTLYPRRWFRIGLANCIRLAEVYGPKCQSWPLIAVLGGIFGGTRCALQSMEIKGDSYVFSKGAFSSDRGIHTVTQCYRFHRAESGAFYFIPRDWPEDEVPERAARARILGPQVEPS